MALAKQTQKMILFTQQMSQDGKEAYMEQILKNIVNWLASSGVKILIALIVMWIAFRIINAIFKKLKKKAEKSDKLDKTLGRLLVSGGRILVKILVALALVGYLGIDTSGVAALIASLGVAVGLAVNGALGNVAGGVLLIVTKPFKVDDFIEVAGYTGTVEEINLCATKLVTVDNRVVYVPNGTASTSNIVNYSEKDIRRVDHTFAIAYGSDFEKAKQLLTEVLSRSINAKNIQIGEYLDKHPEGVEPAVLAEDTHSLRQTITVVLNDLEGRGYLSRAFHSTDRRRKIIRLTQEGKVFARKVLDAISAAEQEAAAILSAEELRRLQDYSRRFSQEFARKVNAIITRGE